MGISTSKLPSPVALQIAHQEGIFHLDLKPANLLLIQAKKGLAVKIINFGLSQVANSLRDEVAGQKTRTGLTIFLHLEKRSIVCSRVKCLWKWSRKL